MVDGRSSPLRRVIPCLVESCHCEWSAAISLRATLGIGLFLWAIVSPAHAKYSGGSGTAKDPYRIATAADLIALGETPADYDKHFVLTADIDLDPNLPGRKVFDKAVIAPDTDQTKDSVQGTSFTGVFDGKDHTISHLTIKGNSYLGLFGQLAKGGEVKNLGVADVSMTGSGDSVGGLVASNSGTVTQCYSTGTIRGSHSVGGLVGSNGGSVSRCYSTSVVSGSNHIGGLVGYNGGGLNQCYSTGTVRGSHSVGGLVGYSLDGTVTQCYSTGAVSGQGSVGGLGGWIGQSVPGVCVSECYSTGAVTGSGEGAGGLVGSLDGNVWVCFWDIQASGQAKSQGGTGKTTAQMGDARTYMAAGWDLVSAGDGPSDIWVMPAGGRYPILWWQLSPWPSLPTFSGGIGEPNDPYRISTAKDLNSIGYNPRLMKCHFKLVADLDLTGLHFYPIGDWEFPYVGILDGNGHTISHLTIKGGVGLGLFGQLASEGEIRNLGVVDVNITTSGEYVGGLVAQNSGTVTQCYSTGMVRGSHSVGGLVGFNGGSVARCYSTSVVSGSYCVGGLVGINDGTVTASYNMGAVTGTGSSVGGLVGYNGFRGTVIQCHSAGTVSGKSTAGGLVGYNDGGYVTDCYSTGAVSGGSYVGGLVGLNYGAVTACFWDTQTSGQAKSAGGTGTTTAQMHMGGTFSCWAGDGTWTIDRGKDYPRLWWENRPGEPLTRAYSYGGGSGTEADPYLIHAPEQLNMIGLVECDWDKHFKLMADLDLTGFHFHPIGAVRYPYAGVFDGNGHTISHLTIKGGSCLGLFGSLGSKAEVKDLGVVDVNITGSGDSVGGLAGINFGAVTDCYSTGAVNGTEAVGGLVGSSRGRVTRCWSTGTVSGSGGSVGGLAGQSYTGAVVIECYSTSAVSAGSHYVGGLVGSNGGTVTRCYSTGPVSGRGYYVAGLVGVNSGAVTQCYSTGVVSGTMWIGGLVAWDYSAGVTTCFWDTQTSGWKASDGGTGKTTAEMQTVKTFLDVGWDFVGETKNGTDDIWWILEGKDYPRLWWELIPQK